MKLGNTLLILASCGTLALVWGACKTEDIDTDTQIGGGGSGAGTTSSGTGGDTGGGTVGGSGGSGGENVGGAGGGTGGAGGSEPTCFDDCDAAFPGGYVIYWDYASCAYCGACYDACDGGTGDVCESGEEIGTCSADAGNDCDTCVNSTCTADQNGGNFSGVCATEYEAFVGSTEALDLNDCYNACP